MISGVAGEGSGTGKSGLTPRIRIPSPPSEPTSAGRRGLLVRDGIQETASRPLEPEGGCAAGAAAALQGLPPDLGAVAAAQASARRPLRQSPPWDLGTPAAQARSGGGTAAYAARLERSGVALDRLQQPGGPPVTAQAVRLAELWRMPPAPVTQAVWGRRGPAPADGGLQAFAAQGLPSELVLVSRSRPGRLAGGGC